MRAAPLAGLLCAAVLLGACSHHQHLHDVRAMQSWVAACEDEPTDETALERIAAAYALEQFSLADIESLKAHAAPDAGAKGYAYVSTVEAWWVDPKLGSYVEVVEWTQNVRENAQTVSKTYRTCLARGYSQSRDGFTQEVHLDPTAGYGFRATKDKSEAWVGTIDGAHPDFAVEFLRSDAGSGFDRVHREAPATEGVTLATGLKRVSQTVGWPARWSFSASADLH